VPTVAALAARSYFSHLPPSFLQIQGAPLRYPFLKKRKILAAKFFLKPLRSLKRGSLCLKTAPLFPFCSCKKPCCFAEPVHQHRMLPKCPAIGIALPCLSARTAKACPIAFPRLQVCRWFQNASGGWRHSNPIASSSDIQFPEYAGFPIALAPIIAPYIPLPSFPQPVLCPDSAVCHNLFPVAMQRL